MKLRFAPSPPAGKVRPKLRERVYALSGKTVNPLPPASPSTSPAGEEKNKG